MKNITLFKTKSNYSYFHSESINQFLLSHPVLFRILTLHKQRVNVRDWLDNINTETVEIEDYGTVSKRELEFYCRKYELLVENGYFNSSDTKKGVGGWLSAFGVNSGLANTSQITYEVTDSCNLKCEYCGYGKFYQGYDQRTDRYLSFKKARNVLDYLLKLFNSPMNKSHGRTVRIGFYGGEPLLNFNFIRQMVEYIKNLPPQCVNFSFGMTTNAVLLDKHMDFLAENNFSLLISLDGNEKNNGYRVFHNGKPSFAIVYKNLMALKKKFPDYYDKRVSINSVLHNKNTVSEIHSFIKEEFKKVPNISELNPGGIAPEMREEFWNTYRNFRESLNQVEDYSQAKEDLSYKLPDSGEMMKTLFQYSGFVSRKYCNLLFPEHNDTFIPTSTCLPFSKKVFVLASGKILPCERIGHRYALGYVDEEEVNLDSDKVAQQMNGYYDKFRSQCENCHIARSCRQCIFYLDLDKEKPVCSGFMNEKNFSEYLSAQMSHLELHPESYSETMKRQVIE